MRGRHSTQTNLISLVCAEDLIGPQDPIRKIKRMVDEVLRAMSPLFEAMYADCGRPSIPPERLLKAKVLQALYSVRSDRRLTARIRTDLLFRWFLDMNLDESVFDATVFTQNQERLLAHDVAVVFFNKVYDIARRNRWASDDHFSADGTLIQAWGSMKSFKPKDAPPGDDDDLNGFADFKGGKRSNGTHASVTDPDARLTRKSAGDASRLCYRADAVSENRNGLCAAVRASPAVGYTESEGAADNIRAMRRRGLRPRTVGADAGYHNERFVDDMRTMNITPHPALHTRLQTQPKGAKASRADLRLGQVRRRIAARARNRNPRRERRRESCVRRRQPRAHGPSRNRRRRSFVKPREAAACSMGTEGVVFWGMRRPALCAARVNPGGF